MRDLEKSKNGRFTECIFVGESEVELSDLVLEEIVRRVNIRKGYHFMSVKPKESTADQYVDK
jgi:hypothetical protein